MINDVYGCGRCANKQEVIDTLLAAETEPHRWGHVLVEKVATLMSILGRAPTPSATATEVRREAARAR
jgi:hypothetical protein